MKIFVSLASPIMAQAGLPCARALNLQILLLKPRREDFPKGKICGEFSSRLFCACTKKCELLHIKPEQHHVAVLHHIVLALGAHLALLSRARKAAAFQKRLPFDDLGADEPLFKIGVDLARCLRRLRALLDGPRPRLLLARGEVRDEP